MGRASRAFKFVLIIFILCLLIQGSYAVEEDNEINTSLNETINGTIDSTNGTTNIDSTTNNAKNSTADNTQKFQWILLLPIFYGNLLFLSWMSRFFDKMNLCFVFFVVIALLVLLLSFFYSLTDILRYLILPMSFIIVFATIIAILYEVFFIQRKGDESNLIENLHDTVRNFIVIFTGLMWPLILLYLNYNDIRYVTFYGIEKLRFPVYIIAASSIGILSYLFLSIETIFSHLVPEYKKISIAWSYLRRISIAPFIALIGFYFLNHLQNINEMEDINDYFVFVFSFFAGVFTKTIEEWIYSWVQKLLPGDKKDEFHSRTESEVKESDFVKKMRFDEDLAYSLYSAKIRTIEELATCNPKDLLKRLNFDARNLGEEMGFLLKEHKERFGSYSERQIKMYIDRAKTYMNIDSLEFVTKLKIDRDLAFMLYYFANIKTLEDLKNCDPHEVYNKLYDCEKEAEELVKREKIDIEKAREIVCTCPEEKIRKLKEKAREELAKGALKPENNTLSHPEQENEA